MMGRTLVYVAMLLVVELALVVWGWRVTLLAVLVPGVVAAVIAVRRAIRTHDAILRADSEER